LAVFDETSDPLQHPDIEDKHEGWDIGIPVIEHQRHKSGQQKEDGGGIPQERDSFEFVGIKP